MNYKNFFNTFKNKSLSLALSCKLFAVKFFRPKIVIFSVIALSFFFIGESYSIVMDSSSSSSPGSPRLNRINSPAPSATEGSLQYVTNIDEYNIEYNKNGVIEKIYTRYLPPKGTFDDNTASEHTLPHCQDLTSDANLRIGNECMIKIPFDCSRAASPSEVREAKNPGVNCINYSSLFDVSSGKNLNPDSSLDAQNKPYCNSLSNPILVINCKLPPCGDIPNDLYRRPGVNCMADCNDSSSKYFAQNKFFIEGFNCLKSCRTTPAPAVFGHNCVLEHNGYVFPLCSDESGKSARTSAQLVKPFNVAKSAIDPRKKCLDVKDMRICKSSSDEAANHFKTCIKIKSTSQEDVHNSNSIDPNITQKCHHGYSRGACLKDRCQDLAPEELNATGLDKFTVTRRNATEAIYFRPNDEYCTSSPYTDFNYKQIKEGGSGSENGYLKNYKLAARPCENLGDTEQKVKTLSSAYYVDSNTSNANLFLQKVIADCKDSYTDDAMKKACDTSETRSFKQYMLYDPSLFCPLDNAVEKISCDNYKGYSPPKVPYNCNSNNTSVIPAPCPSDNLYCHCPRNHTSQDYCYRLGVNCALTTNQKYEVCKRANTVVPRPQPNDPYVSWFFRPTIDREILKSVTINGVSTLKIREMNGDPMRASLPASPSNSINYNRSNIYDNDLLDYLSLCLLGDCITTRTTVINRSLVPGCEGANMGIASVGPTSICGMQNNYRNKPPESSFYYKGEVESTYALDNKINHNVTICLRYEASNALTTSCGSRRCYNYGVGYFSSDTGVCSNVCGHDECRTVTLVTDVGGSPLEDCSSNQKNFNGVHIDSRGRITVPKCISDFHSTRDDVSRDARVRVFKPDPYSNFICAVLEFRNIVTGTSGMGDVYFRGGEFFWVPIKVIEEDPSNRGKYIEKNYFKKLCVSGTFIESSGNCEAGFDTNASNSDVTKWRTVSKIIYLHQPPKSDGSWDGDASFTRVGTVGNVYKLNSNSVTYIDHTGFPNESFSSVDPADNISKTIGRSGYNKKVRLEKSDCIRHELKVAPPVFRENTNAFLNPTLFIPPVKINAICNNNTARTAGNECTIANKTDFYKPSIRVLWGQTDQLYPLNNDETREGNYKIIEITNPDSKKSADYDLYLKNPGFQFNAQIKKVVYIEKSIGIDGEPEVCLYEKEITRIGSSSSSSSSSTPAASGSSSSSSSSSTPAASGSSSSSSSSSTPAASGSSPQQPEPKRVGCVKRVMPTSAQILPKNASSVGYNNLIYRVSYSQPSYNLSQNDAEFISAKTSISDPVLKLNISNNQGFPLYVQREECSLLNLECVDNEKELLDEKNKNPPNEEVIMIKQEISDYCKKNLLPRCNAKKGYYPGDVGYELMSTLNTNDAVGFNRPAKPGYYGWYNEFCIVGGIEALSDPINKKYIFETIPERDGEIDEAGKGVCELSGSSCRFVNPATDLPGINQRLVPATPRQINSSLCYTLTSYYPTCQPIIYETNTDNSDPFFTSNSYLVLEAAHVHQSHVLRSSTSHHANFDIAFPGNTIKGQCNGFWTNFQDSVPTATCDASGSFINISNNCVRFKCSSARAATYGANSLGFYLSSYDSSSSSTSGSQRGLIHGYANWEEFAKNNDLKEQITASSCIIGYKKARSNPRVNGIGGLTGGTSVWGNYYNQTNDLNKKVINSIFGLNTGNFDGGDSPTRMCNQLGQMELVNNACERIKCPSNQNFDMPAYAGALNLDEFGTVTYNSIRKTISAPNSVPCGRLADCSKITFTAPQNIESSGVKINPTNNPSIEIPISGAVNLTKNIKYVFTANATIASPVFTKVDNTNDNLLQQVWEKFGGAKFGPGNASRSSLFIYQPVLNDPDDSHIISGECVTELGFKKISTNPPSLTCDYKGNWTSIKNQCVSDCSAVNLPAAQDESHGFALWKKSTVTVGGTSSPVAESSTGCVSGYIPYPYPPMRDVEGAKGDFGNGAVEGGVALEKYDAIASTSNKSEFITTSAPAASDENLSGAYYNFKLVSSSGDVASASLASGGDMLVELFGPATLNLNAPSGRIFSGVLFASFGYPTNYFNQLEIDNSCHGMYSKLIIAQKCIGKSSCSISLDDFTNYHSDLVCRSSDGNGLNGANAGNQLNGGGGGGGGGNSAASGASLVNNSMTMSSSGNSYCDKSSHIDTCAVSSAENRGLRVNLTQVNSGFDGGNGSVNYWVYSQDSPSAVAIYNNTVTSVGVHQYTVPLASSVAGKVGDIFYIRYEISGGGGGGGGEAEYQGTDGFNGAKVSGKFRVEGGKVIKFHIGGGGKAGKTGCDAASSSASGSGSASTKSHPIFAENHYDNFIYNINNAQNYAQNNAFLTNKLCDTRKINSKKDNLIIASLKKIGEFFIDDARANYICGIDRGSCSASYCYQHSSYTGSGNNCQDLVAMCEGWYNPLNRKYRKVGTISNFASFSSICKDEYPCDGASGYTSSGGYCWKGVGCGPYSYISDDGRYCFSNSCTANVTNNSFDISRSVSGSGTDTYSVNSISTGSSGYGRTYTGSIDYECIGNGGAAYVSNHRNANVSCIDGYEKSGCATNSCTVSAATGFSSRTIYYNTTSLACDGANFDTNTSLTFPSCTTDGDTLTPSGTCPCAEGYALSGSNCVRKKCNIPTAGTGYLSLASATLDYTKTWTSRSCNANGYSGNISYKCEPSGATGAATMATSSTGSGTTVCSAISCTLTHRCIDNPASSPSTSKSVSGSGTETCNRVGYSGSLTYYCVSGVAAATISDGSSCDTGYALSGSNCVRKKCNIPSAGTGYLSLATNTLDYTSTWTSRTCDADGYEGNISYKCEPSGATGAATMATASSGAGSSVCSPISCTVTDDGINNAGSTSKSVSATGTITCNRPGYSGSISYVCQKNAAGVASARITSSPSTCTLNSCNISADTVSSRYSSQTGLTGSGTFDCNEDHYGTVSYTCNSGSTLPTVTPNCTSVKCIIPESANSNVVANAAGEKIVNFAKAFTNYSCASGYKNSFNEMGVIASAQYKCTKNTSTGVNNGVIEIKYPCEIISCSNSIFGRIEVDTSDPTAAISRDCPNDLGLFGTASFTCSELGEITWNTKCQDITCKMPPCSAGSECAAMATKNTTQDGTNITFSGSWAPLTCREGYYYNECAAGVTANCGRPQYKCTFDATQTTAADKGKLEFSGGDCLRTKCMANDDLKSTIDGTEVEYTGSAGVTTSCKAGYYLDVTPKYYCLGSGSRALYYIEQPCLPIQCSISGVRGVLDKTNLDFGDSMTATCDQPGYSGNLIYNCRNGTGTEGTFSIVSNNCILRACNRSANNVTTFDALVNASGTSVGGDGGVILSAQNFLKGGNGGNSFASVNSSSGGGGGSASMIEVDNKIIVIAGGGGGGNGGGSDVQSNSQMLTSSIADYSLNAKIFGKYLLANLEYSPIPISETASDIAGIFYSISDSDNAFEVASNPAGTFIRDIFFSSFGNPELPDSLSSSPFILKQGTCHAQNSNQILSTTCLSQENCAIADITRASFDLCTPPLATPSLAVLGSYFYREPTLSVNGGPALKIKEFDRNTKPISPILRNNGVYSFLMMGDPTDNSAYWLKREFLADNFEITLESVPSRIKLQFVSQNLTFSPTLSIRNSAGQIISNNVKIVKEALDGSEIPLSRYYIKPNINYVLTRNVNNRWSIKIHTFEEVGQILPADRVPPKRVCTIAQLSESGNVGVVWSAPNSKCINRCPGYDKTTKEGDDRIGVGVTRHKNRQHGSNFFKVAWSDQAFGTWQFKEFNGNVTDGFYDETSGLKPNSFNQGRVNRHFILARKCNTDGSWSDPVGVCPSGDDRESPDNSVNGNKSRLNSSNFFDNQNSSNRIRYLRANESADYSTSVCYDSSYLKTSKGTYYDQGVYENYIYKCVKANEYEDSTYLAHDGSTDRKDCIKYCNAKDFRSGGSTILIPTDNKYVRANTGSSTANGSSDGYHPVQCASGYLNARDSSGRPGSNPPKIRCSGGDSSPSWDSSITNDCVQAQPCVVSQEMYRVKDSHVIPLRPFLKTEHKVSIPHNTSVDYGTKQVCGYTRGNKYCEACTALGCLCISSTEKFDGYYGMVLKSYYCNDGKLTTNSVVFRSACDGDDWDWNNNHGSDSYGESHPGSQYLGGTKGSNKKEAYDTFTKDLSISSDKKDHNISTWEYHYF